MRVSLGFDRWQLSLNYSQQLPSVTSATVNLFKVGFRVGLCTPFAESAETGYSSHTN